MSRCTSSPLVSIAIPAYKPGPLFRETLKTCLAQTYQNLEIVVAIDGDSPDVLDIINEFDDARIRTLTGDGVRYGQHGNFNRAVDATQGELVKLFCADDLMAESCIETMVDCLSSHPEHKFVASTHMSFDYLDGDGRNELAGTLRRYVARSDKEVIELNSDEAPWWNALAGNFIGGPSNVMFNREAWWQMGGLDPRMNFAGDRELWYRMMNFYGVLLITKPLVGYRRHSNSVAGRESASIAPFEDGLRLVETVEPSPPIFSQKSLQRELRRLQTVNQLSTTAVGLLKRSPSLGIQAILRVLSSGGLTKMPLNATVAVSALLRRGLAPSDYYWPFWRLLHAEHWELIDRNEESILNVLNGVHSLQEVAKRVS